MRTKATELLGIDLPIFAFSHCRDVVAEVTKAGGMGVLGAAWMTTEHLEQELRWIDTQVGGKPYGVDLVFPGKYAPTAGEKDLGRLIPDSHRRFINEVLDSAGIPRLPEDEAESFRRSHAASMDMTPQHSQALFEIVMKHPASLVVSALGVPPKSLVDRVHQAGRKVGALVGKAAHAKKQKQVGVDLIIAQGAEAGGHTGNISSMVLWPQIVDAVAPLPVLAAGGIGRGRQMAAAFALGAEGIWCGSIWLGTRQSEINPDLKERLFAAGSDDAIVTRALTGKPCRSLRSRYTEAWDLPGAPAPLQNPLQSILGGEPLRRIDRARAKEFMTYAVGQIVGDMSEETNVKQVVYDLLVEFADAVERLNRLVQHD